MPAVTAQPPATRGMVWCHLLSYFFHSGNNLSCKDTLTKMPPLQKICIFLPGWFRASNLYRTGVHVQMLSRQTWGRHVVLRPWLNDKWDPDSILWAFLLERGSVPLHPLQYWVPLPVKTNFEIYSNFQYKLLPQLPSMLSTTLPAPLPWEGRRNAKVGQGVQVPGVSDLLLIKTREYRRLDRSASNNKKGRESSAQSGALMRNSHLPKFLCPEGW